ncbi:hypothetical protein CPB84DRAFT_1815905 [Gymnopilus junonius]|uniref:DUF6534 domain-containing protein n=1 Tax=Gymnopilus junonius TaxID=109634 RepID=A0A9P5TL42_GYMJU|nr:hypothetical protein CPB84DRAFT_1815905 [Gymnopilus junonius]
MGAMMIGVIVSAVLHGVTLMQAFLYFTNYKKDIWIHKVLVLTTVCFDAIHLALISSTGTSRLLFMEALFTGVNGGIVQMFYTMRVWRLSNRNYYLSGLILFLILSTTAWVIISMQFKTFRQLLSITPLTITINALSTTVDVLIASSLCIMLHNSRTGFKRCCAVASLICLSASSHSLIYATFYFCIGRFYTNSFLATLNARKSIASRIDDTSHVMMSIPTAVTSPQVSSGGKNITIRIDTTKEMNDGDRSVLKAKGVTTNWACRRKVIYSRTDGSI